MEKKSLKKNKGFTLIELLVSITIFVLILTVSLGSMLTILNSNKKAQGLESIMSNVNFALESIVRHIRFGYNYSCSPNCGSGDSITLNFRDPETGVSETITYKLTVVDNIGRIERQENGGSFRPITGKNIDIERLIFDIHNNPTELVHSVHILVEGYADQTKSKETKFTLQTLASQR